MDKIKDYDDEGFELEFEDDTTPEEKKYFVQAYPNVNMVADKRLHCTCCNMHIGTAPNAEKLIRMHPVLRVTQCTKCYRFYNSGEFEKGEDGSELYCRWCGQGGDVYCCSDCPYVFCKKCILRNLTKVALNNVTSNENWKCFSCAPKILYHLRAQHWALVNFIEKQKKKIERFRKTADQDQIADAMSHDSSQCCHSRKKTSDGKKRRLVLDDDSSDDSEDSNWSSKKRQKTAKKSVSESSADVVVPAAVAAPTPAPASKKKPDPPAQVAPVKKVVPKPVPPAPKTIPPAQKNVPPAIAPVISNMEEPAEIDCTPDLFAFLVNHSYEQTHGEKEQSENSVSSSTGASSTVPTPSTSKSQPTPAQRQSQPKPTASAAAQAANSDQFVRRVARATTQGPNQPVYHNYNGYRIDLNSAAQQSTIRLPNGKVIHVKKQAPINNGRNEPTRYSISTAAALPTPNRAPMVRTPAQRLPQRPAPQPQRPPPQPQRPQERPTFLQSYTQRLQGVQPPPLVINSVRSAGPLPQMQQISSPRMRAQGPSRPMNSNHMPLQDAQMHLQQQMMMQNQVRNPTPTVQIPSNVAAVLNALPQPKIYSNDEVGRARTQLEQQIFNSISICHQIDGKLKTLMNSNAYKNAQKLPDIKELYIHLSYLFTYTKGRFQTIHDKCMEDMERLGFKSDATSLSSGNVIDKYGSDVDDDDLEIVEPNHQTINLDSDDEGRTPEKNRSKSTANVASTSQQQPITPESVPLSNHDELNTSAVILDINSSAENLECDVDVASLLQINMNIDEDDDHGEFLLSRMNDDVGIATPPDTEEPEVVNIENDLKLKSRATISLKPVEETYPELMEKALQKMNESHIEIGDDDDDDDDKENEDKTNEEKEENEDKTNEEKEENEQEPEKSSSIQSPDENDDKDDNEIVQENAAKDNENQSENAKNDENELSINDIENSVDDTENTTDDPKQNEDTHNDSPEVENVENEMEIQEIEATTSAQEVVDSTENEAESIENTSDNDDKDASNEESHAEITSTSMVIENDVDMLDGSNDNKKDGDRVDNDGNDSNEVSTVETGNDDLNEIGAECNDQNETESLFDDLDINNSISTSDALNVVASIFDNNDFENISSPETFN